MKPHELVRYCPSCSHIGEFSATALNCCPEHDESYVPLKIAEQAKRGFMARLKELEDAGKVFEEHDKAHHI